jgi:hypothetical protein
METMYWVFRAIYGFGRCSMSLAMKLNLSKSINQPDQSFARLSQVGTADALGGTAF